jgi:hypothetical protein
LLDLGLGTAGDRWDRWGPLGTAGDAGDRRGWWGPLGTGRVSKSSAGLTPSRGLVLAMKHIHTQAMGTRLTFTMM